MGESKSRFLCSISTALTFRPACLRLAHAACAMLSATGWLRLGGTTGGLLAFRSRAEDWFLPPFPSRYYLEGEITANSCSASLPTYCFQGSPGTALPGASSALKDFCCSVFCSQDPGVGVEVPHAHVGPILAQHHDELHWYKPWLLAIILLRAGWRAKMPPGLWWLQSGQVKPPGSQPLKITQKLTTRAIHPSSLC